MDAKQRKLLSNLLISGTVLIAFALLDAIKLVVYLVVDPMYRLIFESIFAEDIVLGWTIIGLICGGTILEIIFGCFIGFSARAEAKGKRRNIFYIIVAIIMAVFLTVGNTYMLIESFTSSEITVFSVIDSLVSVGLSAVVVYSIFDVVICSIKNRKINKENGKTTNQSIDIESIDIVDEEIL